MRRASALHHAHRPDAKKREKSENPRGFREESPEGSVASQLTRGTRAHQSADANQTIVLRFFIARTLTTLRAGLALNVVSWPVKGLMPLRALVAGLRTTVTFIRPGT